MLVCNRLLPIQVHNGFIDLFLYSTLLYTNIILTLIFRRTSLSSCIDNGYYPKTFIAMIPLDFNFKVALGKDNLYIFCKIKNTTLPEYSAREVAVPLARYAVKCGDLAARTESLHSLPQTPQRGEIHYLPKLDCDCGLWTS